MSPAPVETTSKDTAKVGTKYDLSIGSDGDKSRQMVVNIVRREDGRSESGKYGLLCRCNALRPYCCGHGCNVMNGSRMQCNDIIQQCIIRHIASLRDRWHCRDAMNKSRMQCNDITQDTMQQCIIRHIAWLQDRQHCRDAMNESRMQCNDITQDTMQHPIYYIAA